MIATQIPTTLAERLALGAEAQYWEASFEEFEAALDKVEFPIEYDQGNIIAMSIASDPHEQIVANIIGELHIQLKGNKNYKRYASSRHVYIAATKSAYAPDASVVRGTPEIFTYATGKNANTNPWLVVEVLSPSTRNRDLGDKLTNYKSCPSLQYILYVEQDRCYATLHQRIDESERWRSEDFNALDQRISIAEFEVSLADIYDNLEVS